MCGIAGIIGDYKNYDFNRMLWCQNHRGPDATQVFQDKDLAVLGHNRLAIIDLSFEANQPFLDGSSRYVIVFNGEIYNYIELKSELKSAYNFKTESDTEVLLAAYMVYGKECLHKLNGMFAFAIWDLQNQHLFAARDRFGVKPFFYTNVKGAFLFSSEIKAIHNSGTPKEPNQKVWINYFSSGSYGMPNETFWEEVHQLPPGHYLEYQGDTTSITKWYDFVLAVKNQPQINDYNQAKEHYKSLLLESIKLRFRADVPIGINISGGLDSSALLAFVNVYTSNSSQIEAFTFYTGNSDYDELPWVEDMIKHYPNPLHKVLLSSVEVPGLIEKISEHQDEPFGGIPTLAYAKLFECASKKGIKVLLDGQGMDEQLAGYDYYTNNVKSSIQGVTKSPFRPEILKEHLLIYTKTIVYPTPFDNAVQNLQYRDLFYTKIPRALRFNDRISMAFSTELREPFLDYKMVEFAFSLPIEYKINKNQSKKILRDILKDYVPDTLAYAPKRPLQTPQREWLGHELKGYVESHLFHIKSGPFKDWFCADAIDKVWNDYCNGDNESSFHIWQLVNFSVMMTPKEAYIS
ncbi:asparagine synthase (glutamine-hydrolyzing) [Gelidibacter salicanalis]|uniref:asparagine synthase (glutamine-hydrolyzing) n=1 Tax=Gelidibacter salicanalis TaxID=291193 RepID=A0A5C7AC90_9FLAO|nr:asparagine synthase (glutamine-hydrolyzing) [Gelidibacter salicanalis]TXE05847.1 asparagine synthase (glutamine-hydrolyzing) [Gelidibacter salicanalis]